MTRRPCILLADDDDLLLKALSCRLEKMNMDIIKATDGFTSLAKAAEHRPDLLILDVNMPAADGFCVQERLKGDPALRNIPVIYLTGDQSPRLDAIAEEVGGFALFHKPFKVQELIDAINRALRPLAA